jgi:MFS family permease
LAAVPEVAATYNSTGTVINLSNALYMLFMGVSPCVYGPLSQVYGRRIVSIQPGVS